MIASRSDGRFGCAQDMWPSLLDPSLPSPRRIVPLSSAHGPPGWGEMSKTGPCIQPGVLAPIVGRNKTMGPRCTQGAIIVDDFKLYYGPYTHRDWSCEYCWWQAPRYPSTTFPVWSYDNSKPFNCPPTGCLFNLTADIEERHDLSAALPEKLAELTREFEAMQKTVWWSPGGAEKSKALCEAVAAHGNFAAPYNQSGDMPRGPAV